MNLKNETIKAIGKREPLWVGCKPGGFSGVSFSGKKTWEEFLLWADFKYDGGYGVNEVSLNLVVVGQDWWLERHEYDGSEWWELKEIPLKEDYNDLPRQ